MKTLSRFTPASMKTLALTVATGALVLSNTVAAHAAYNPGFTPNFDNPATTPLNNIAGIILAVSLIVTGILAICAVILFIIGKVFHQGKAQEKGMSIILWALAGAVLLVSISGIIYWATSDFQINFG